MINWDNINKAQDHLAINNLKDKISPELYEHMKQAWEEKWSEDFDTWTSKS